MLPKSRCSVDAVNNEISKAYGLHFRELMANDNIYRRHHDPIIIITSTEMKRYERLDILHDGPDAICIV